jgi:hypothetical protein
MDFMILTGVFVILGKTYFLRRSAAKLAPAQAGEAISGA